MADDMVEFLRLFGIHETSVDTFKDTICGEAGFEPCAWEWI